MRVKYMVEVIVLIFGITLSLSGFFLLRYFNEVKFSEHFNKQSSAFVLNLNSELLGAGHILNSFKGLYLASTHVSREEFQQFYKAIEEGLFGVQAIEWVPVVSKKERMKYEAEGKEFAPSFFFKEKNESGTLVKAKERKEYYPIFYIEPYKGNEAALGYDLGESKDRKVALKKAEAIEALSVSNKIQLVQDTKTKNAILMFVPVIKGEKVLGFISGVFKINELVKGGLKNVEEKLVNVTLTDKGDVREDNILYGKKVDSSLFKFYYQKDMKVGDRVWLIECYTDYNVPIPVFAWIVLFIGGGITFSIIFYISYIEYLIKSRTKQLNVANETKNMFLSNMSHEIRTPLTSIIGYTEVLQEEKELNPDTKIEMLNRISKNGKYLLSLVNDILDLSKIESNNFEVERNEVNLQQFAQEIEKEFSHRAEEKGLNFEVDFIYPIPKSIIIDAFRLRQVMLNLCANAIKFTTKGYVQLIIRCSNDKKILKIEVADTGIGIDSEKLESIFNPFEQADSSISKIFGGTGLGLCISRKISKQLGGNLYVKSKIGQGSIFTFELPITYLSYNFTYAKEKEEEVVEDEKVEWGRLKGCVLLAEDLSDNQKLITWYLTKLGVKYDIAENGNQAIEMVLKNRNDYDLILMDIQMPYLDGLTAMKNIKQKGISIPIVALTANAMKYEVEEYLNSGFSGFLSKPINKNDFFALLSGYLEKQTITQKEDLEEKKIPLEDIDEFADFEDEDDFEKSEEFLEIKKSFVDSIPQEIEKLKEVSKQEDKGDFMRAAHNLKSSGRTFKFMVLGNIAEVVEKAIKRDDLTDALDSLTKLIEELENVYKNNR